MLAKASEEPVARDLRPRVFELGEALFRVFACDSAYRDTRRSARNEANLDAIDAPLNNRRWLEIQFAAVRSLADESSRLRAVDAIVRKNGSWSGWVLRRSGRSVAQPHLVPGPGLPKDPMQRLTLAWDWDRGPLAVGLVSNAENFTIRAARSRVTRT